MQPSRASMDSQAQLRNLYRALLEHEERYQEFKHLLAMYPCNEGMSESEESLRVRAQLNARIQEWVGQPCEGLSAMQMNLWRAILVEERFNVALAPWKESNTY